MHVPRYNFSFLCLPKDTIESKKNRQKFVDQKGLEQIQRR